MTTPTPPCHPNPSWPPNQQAPAPKKNRGRVIAVVIAAVVGLFVVIGGTVAFTLAATNRDGSAETAKTPTAWEREQAANVGGPTGEDLITPTPTAGPTPKPDDFELIAKVTDKECFGSAGCLVEFRVDLGYGGPELDSDDTWLLTYEVRGVDDAPRIGSLEITGKEYTVPVETVDTSSSKSKISIKVTSVEKLGY